MAEWLAEAGAIGYDSDDVELARIIPETFALARRGSEGPRSVEGRPRAAGSTSSSTCPSKHWRFRRLAIENGSLGFDNGMPLCRSWPSIMPSRHTNEGAGTQYAAKCRRLNMHGSLIGTSMLFGVPSAVAGIGPDRARGFPAHGSKAQSGQPE